MCTTTVFQNILKNRGRAGAVHMRQTFMVVFKSLFVRVASERGMSIEIKISEVNYFVGTC